MKRAFCIVLILGAFTIFTQEYEVFGTINLDAHLPVFGEEVLLEANQNLGWIYSLKANHRLQLEQGEFAASHSIEYANLQWEEWGPQMMPQDWYAEIYTAYFLFNPFASLNLSLGRIRTQWGTGANFAPGDRINPYGLDFMAEKGFDGVALTWEPAHWFGLKLIGSLNDTLEEPRDPLMEDVALGVETTLYLGITELSAAIQYRKTDLLRPSASLSTDLWGMILTAETGAEFNNNLLYPEAGTLQTKEKGQPYPFFDISAHRTWYKDDWSFTLMGEYFYQGEGYSDSQIEELAQIAVINPTELLKLPGRLPPFLRQKYLYASAAAANSEWFSLEGSCFFNLDDLSYMVMPHFQFIRIEGMDLGLRMMAIRGEKDSEYGANPMSDIWFYTSIHF